MQDGVWLGRWVLAATVVFLGLGHGCSASREFSFDVTADMRFYTPPDYTGSRYFPGVCEAIRDLGPGAFMVSPGDLDPPDRVRATLDAILGSDYVWYPVVGNHEKDQPEYLPYLRQYNENGTKLPGIVRVGPPGAVETCYAFDHENAHFVVINQYYENGQDSAGHGDMPDPLYNWLAEDLTANDKPFVFVFGHEPSVAIPDMDSGRVRHRGDSLDQNPETNHRFWSLLRKHNVVAYFCGHTHNLSVCKLNGVWQIDCGHARGIGDPGSRSTFLKIHVTSDSVRCIAYRYDTESESYEPTYTERLR